MSKPVVTVKTETSIEALTEIMAAHDYNAFPVVNDVGVLPGLVTRLDLFKLYLLPYHRFIPALEATWVSSVGAIMSRGVVALYPVEPAIRAMALMVEHRTRAPGMVEPKAPLREVRRLMAQHGIRHVPVVSGEGLVGIVSDRDVQEALPSPADPRGATGFATAMDRIAVWDGRG